MRYLLLMVALSALTLPAAAAPSCSGSSDLISVERWSIEPVDAQRNRLTVVIKNNGDKPIRMIDGSVGFEDALGGHVASYSIERDASIPALGEFEEVGSWGPYTFERLLDLKPEEVTAYSCVRSVLFEDGSRVDF